MINLLPNQTKENILFARRNNRLIKWNIFCGIALLGVGLIIAGGYIYMRMTINSYSKQLEESRTALNTQNVEQTKKQVENLSNNTKLTVQVLSREILFSKLLPQIGSALPPETILQSLQIDKVQGGIQLSARAADFEAATQLQLNLQDQRNQVFEKADINSIDCIQVNPETPRLQRMYPCDVNLKALFSKNNSYLFISPTAQPEKKQ